MRKVFGVFSERLKKKEFVRERNTRIICEKGKNEKVLCLREKGESDCQWDSEATES